MNEPNERCPECGCTHANCVCDSLDELPELALTFDPLLDGDDEPLTIKGVMFDEYTEVTAAEVRRCFPGWFADNVYRILNHTFGTEIIIVEGRPFNASGHVE